ncbi:hypothetical protein GCM10028808_74910 [Spirosoma migulaei]
MNKQTTPPADNRPMIPTVTQDYVDVNKDVYDAQSKLLVLVDDFLACGAGCSPTEAINDLLYEWLITPAAVLASDHSRRKLLIVLQLVTFLSDLRDELANVNWLTEEARKLREVGHE